MALLAFGIAAARPRAEPPEPWAGAAYVPVAQLNGAPAALAVSGSRIFVVQGTRLFEIDGEDPTQLRPAGPGLILPTRLDRLAVDVGRLAGLAGTLGGPTVLELVDISVPGAPRWTARIAGVGGIGPPALDGGWLYYLSAGLLRRYGVSGPGAPYPAGSLALPDGVAARALAVSDGRAFVASENGLTVVDGRAETMAVLSRYLMKKKDRMAGLVAYDVAADDDRAVLLQAVTPPPRPQPRPGPTDETVTPRPTRSAPPTPYNTPAPYLRVLDLAALPPQPLGELRDGVQASAAAVDGPARRAYVLPGGALRIIELDDPTGPLERVAMGTNARVAPVRIGEHLLLLERQQLRRLDTERLPLPADTALLDLPSWQVADVEALAPGLAVVVEPHLGLRVVDHRDAERPQVLSVYPVPDLRSISVPAGSGRVYMLDGADLVVLALADGRTLREVSRRQLGPEVNANVKARYVPDRIDVAGGMALVALGGGGLQLVDLTEVPPVPVGRATGCRALQVTAFGAGFAALLCPLGSELQVFDVRDVRQPRQVAVIPIPSTVRRSLAVGKFLYLADDPPLLLDLREPSQPRVVDGVLGAERIDDAKAFGDEVYALGDTVKVFDVTQPDRPKPLATIVVPRVPPVNATVALAALALDEDRLLVGDTEGAGLTVMVPRDWRPVPTHEPTPTHLPPTPTRPTQTPTASATVPATAPPTAAPPDHRLWLPWSRKP
jgi:hypothetical protein